MLPEASFGGGDVALSVDVGAALKSPNASNPPLLSFDTGENGELPMASAAFAGSADVTVLSVGAGVASKSPKASKLDLESVLVTATGENGELPEASAGFSDVDGGAMLSAEVDVELKSPKLLKSLLLSTATGEKGEFPVVFSGADADAALSVDTGALKSPNESNPLVSGVVAAAGEGVGENSKLPVDSIFVAGSDGAGALSVDTGAASKSPKVLALPLSAATGEKIKFSVATVVLAGVAALSLESGAVANASNSGVSVVAGGGIVENGELSGTGEGSTAKSVLVLAAAAGDGTGENGEFPGTSAAAGDGVGENGEKGEFAGASSNPALSLAAAGDGVGENGDFPGVLPISASGEGAVSIVCAAAKSPNVSKLSFPPAL